MNCYFIILFLSVEEKPDAKEYVFKGGEITFLGATFGYTPQNILFKNLNLTFKRNTFISLCGESGVGKSTIFNLIVKKTNQFSIFFNVKTKV
jgi:ATP-binding cassette subfamily B (MDR/TAP) protein 7